MLFMVGLNGLILNKKLPGTYYSEFKLMKMDKTLLIWVIEL